MTDKLLIGSLESCGLPDLGISDLKIRVDTGAKTSSLHVDNIKEFIEKGKPWIQFDIHPDFHNVETIKHCRAPVADIRKIKSSNAETEQRYVIRTHLELGDQTWEIELTLTDRSDMSYLMLLGREAMGSRVLIDPSKSFIASDG